MDGLQSGIQPGYPSVAGAYTPQFVPQATLGGSPLSGILNAGIGGLFGNQIPRQPMLPFNTDPVTAAYLQQAQLAQQAQLVSPYATNPLVTNQIGGAGGRMLPLGVDPITAAYIQQAQIAQLIQLIQQVQAQQAQQQLWHSPFAQTVPFGQTSWLGGPGAHIGRTLPFQFGPVGFMGTPAY